MTKSEDKPEVSMEEIQINSIELQKLHRKIMHMFEDHFGNPKDKSDRREWGRQLITCLGVAKMVEKTVLEKAEEAGLQISAELFDGPVPGAHAQVLL